MPRQILASTRKDFWTSFAVLLPGRPVSCRAANVKIFGELLSEKGVLAFGTYDVIFLCQKGGGPDASVYETVLFSRSFSESVQFVGSGINVNPGGTVEARAEFSQPLRLHFRPGKITNLRIGDLLKSLFSGGSCVEVQVESEITAEIALAKKTETELATAGAAPGPPEEKITPAEDSLPGLEKLAALVARYLQLEKEKKGGVQDVTRQDQKGADQPFSAAAAASSGVRVPHPILSQPDLLRIPSRPGLEKALLLDAPPQKPPEAGG